MPAPALFLLAAFSPLLSGPAGHAADLELRAKVAEANGFTFVEYWSGPTLVGRSTKAAPAGVELRLPEANAVPVQFRTSTRRDNEIELGPTFMV